MRHNYKVKFSTTPATISQHNATAIHAFVPCLHTFQYSVTAENRLLDLQPFMNSHFNFLITVECVQTGQMLQIIVVLCRKIVVLCRKITIFHLNKRDAFILIIKLLRCTNFSNLFTEQNSTCFGQFLCPSSAVFHCIQSNGICHAAC